MKKLVSFLFLYVPFVFSGTYSDSLKKESEQDNFRREIECYKNLIGISGEVERFYNEVLRAVIIPKGLDFQKANRVSQNGFYLYDEKMAYFCRIPGEIIKGKGYNFFLKINLEGKPASYINYSFDNQGNIGIRTSAESFRDTDNKYKDIKCVHSLNQDVRDKLRDRLVEKIKTVPKIHLRDKRFERAEIHARLETCKSIAGLPKEKNGKNIVENVMIGLPIDPNIHSLDGKVSTGGIQGN